MKTNVGLGSEITDVVQTENGRFAYLIQIHPDNKQVFNLTEGQHPWGKEGEVMDLPENAQLVFDPATLDDAIFTFYCPECKKRFVDRGVFGPFGPRCPKCEPE